jgi:para-aminobenzoate synthetase
LRAFFLSSAIHPVKSVNRTGIYRDCGTYLDGKEAGSMRTLIIDNYDSFTYNVFHLLASVNGREPLVVRNDELPWDELQRLDYDNVVLSPGPGTPTLDADFGICARLIREETVPVLGICLGHQGICHVLGGGVERAPVPMHGRLSDINHAGCGLFQNLPSPFRAVARRAAGHGLDGGRPYHGGRT